MLGAVVAARSGNGAVFTWLLAAKVNKEKADTPMAIDPSSTAALWRDNFMIIL
jgi:hypothetical protein